MDDSTAATTSDSEYADENADPNNGIFSDKQVAFEDDNFRINVEKVRHIQQKRFTAEEHMYDVTLDYLNANGPEQIPLIKSLQQIYKALKVVIKRLKKNYLKDDDDHRQVYTTIISRKMIRGLRTGNYDLKTPTSIIATHIIYMLYYFLQSKAKSETLLDDSFKINFKVLSRAGVQRRRGKGNFREHIYKHNGCGVSSDLSTYEKSCLLVVPDSFPGGSANHFSNLCLLTSMIVADEQYKSKVNQSTKEQDSDYLKLRYIDKPHCKVKCTRAGRLLFNLVTKVMSSLEPHDRLSYTEAVDTQTVSLKFLTPFAKMMGAQVNVISQRTKKIIARFPEESSYEQQKKQFYLYQVMSTESHAHLYPVTDIRRFQTRYGKTCLACNHFKSSVGYRACNYECLRTNCVKHCRTCCREVLWPETAVNALTTRQFCDNFTTSSAWVCSQCDTLCNNAHCLELHRKICTGGRVCEVCNVRIKAGANHVCFSKFCKFCQVEVSPEHACLLQTPRAHSTWNRFATLDLSFTNSSAVDCY